MVISSIPSHDATPSTDPPPPVEDEPPICGYNEKPTNESVTTIDERSDDDVTELAHTTDVAFLARHLSVNTKYNNQSHYQSTRTDLS